MIEACDIIIIAVDAGTKPALLQIQGVVKCCPNYVVRMSLMFSNNNTMHSILVYTFKILNPERLLAIFKVKDLILALTLFKSWMKYPWYLANELKVHLNSILLLLDRSHIIGIRSGYLVKTRPDSIFRCAKVNSFLNSIIEE